MATTLGLDVGTNSIGWALVEDGVKILKSGVRIFPVGVKEEDFQKNGKEVSKNIDRRMARGARRRRFRFRLRRQKLIGLLMENGLMPGNDEFFSTRELYRLRVKGLDDKLSLTEFGRILLMLNKRRGFKSNRKAAADPEKRKEEGIVKEEISHLQKKIDESQSRTVGEFFYSLFERADKEKDWPNEHTPIERIRDRFVGREMYEKEFNALWTKQAEYYPDVLTADLKRRIGDETIYYQRNLKSQKGLVGKCRFEPGKRCAQRSSFEFQEYRIWQQLWMIRFASGDRIGEELTPQENQRACAALMRTEKMAEAKLKSLLGVPKSVYFNDVVNDKTGVKGNRTSADLIKALGEKTFDALTDEQRFELWHILTYTDNTDKLKEIVRNKIAKGILPFLTDEQIDNYSGINLEEGFCNLSKKALNKILPHLREGIGLTEAIQSAGYDPTRKIVKGKTVELSKVPPLAPNELRNPIVQQMLSETFRVINAIIKEYGKPDMVRIELARELKRPKTKREEARNNSIRKRSLREEYAQFLNKKLGMRVEPNSPEVRKYELWLEMGCEDQSLDDLKSFMKNSKVTDHLKYELWRECGRISPYSGKVIPLTKLFSPEIQIEHILPYSKTMNNEFGNLCLCEAEINKKKGDRLPYEYFQSTGKLEEFKSNIARLQNEAKRRRFLAREIPEGFLNSQLTNTSYAARDLAWRLSSVFPPVVKEGKESPRVQVVNGQATSDLRRLWGNLNKILSDGDIDTKNRSDHRHHAIDAIIIACTTPGVIHTLSTSSKFNMRGQLTNDIIEEPWPGFRGDCAESINSIIVSYRNQKRLIGVKPNKIKTKNIEKNPPKGIIRRRTTTIRGAMHEETIYGRITERGNAGYVSRWMLRDFAELRDLEKIVDPKVREVLLERVRRFGGNVKEALVENPADPILMYSRKGVIVPIKRVRVRNDMVKDLVQIRPGAFVQTRNNYAIALYQDQKGGKRKFETVSFYEAVRRAMNHEHIVKSHIDGCPLLFSLKQHDTVVRYERHPDEINWDDMEDLRRRLFRVREFSVTGKIILDYLYAARLDKTRDRNILFFQANPNTLKCVKVDVDLLGRIVKKEALS